MAANHEQQSELTYSLMTSQVSLLTMKNQSTIIKVNTMAHQFVAAPVAVIRAYFCHIQRVQGHTRQQLEDKYLMAQGMKTQNKHGGTEQ
jgi:hypothetical protein